ncbi:MAG: LLM class F420-dependent oxidoreductase [Chloroflexi bacterium]|nr:LLM class F420-dependent oxidoreductase [Chloroflexota bacterium]
MKIGVVFPQIEFPADAAAYRDYAQAAEALGYTHILAYDHILGANPDRPGGWSGPYTYQDPFHEPFTLFSYLSGVTSQLGFVTGVIILPQRDTALVAKQAAMVDILCGGRLRLGIGIGWNEVEYVATGNDFHQRGRKSDEQIDLLRELWTKPLVNFQGQYHTIPDAGINPLPIQRPIPIWLGGHAEAVLSRIARKGDGWLPGYRTAAAAAKTLARLDTLLAEQGRSRADMGIETRLLYQDGTPESWQTIMQDWQAAGATHGSINTMGCGFTTVEQHIEALRVFAAAVSPG